MTYSILKHTEKTLNRSGLWFLGGVSDFSVAFLQLSEKLVAVKDYAHGLFGI